MLGPFSRRVADRLTYRHIMCNRVAAHVWALIGAKSAECLTALLARNGVAPLMLARVPQPEVFGPDLTEVANTLVRLDSPASWNAALIKRTGNDTIDVFPEPHVTVCDLNEAPDRLLAAYKR